MPNMTGAKIDIDMVGDQALVESVRKAILRELGWAIDDERGIYVGFETTASESGDTKQRYVVKVDPEYADMMPFIQEVVDTEFEDGEMFQFDVYPVILNARFRQAVDDLNQDLMAMLPHEFQGNAVTRTDITSTVHDHDGRPAGVQVVFRMQSSLDHPELPQTVKIHGTDTVVAVTYNHMDLG